jgi:hypothetical protein
MMNGSASEIRSTPLSQSFVSVLIPLIKKFRPPRQKGVRGGCSPQNNHEKAWTPQGHAPVAQGDHLHFTKKVSNIDASQVA